MDVIKLREIVKCFELFYIFVFDLLYLQSIFLIYLKNPIFLFFFHKIDIFEINSFILDEILINSNLGSDLLSLRKQKREAKRATYVS